MISLFTCQKIQVLQISGLHYGCNTGIQVNAGINGRLFSNEKYTFEKPQEYFHFTMDNPKYFRHILKKVAGISNSHIIDSLAL